MVLGLLLHHCRDPGVVGGGVGVEGRMTMTMGDSSNYMTNRVSNRDRVCRNSKLWVVVSMVSNTKSQRMRDLGERQTSNKTSNQG